MRPLTGVVRCHDWGSHTWIASLQGRAGPSEQPEAELWLGAHPSAPSIVADEGAALSEVIARDSATLLGDRVVGRFGARLPYLLKVLAAAQPLSLQAHPDAEQARLGFASETGPIGARNYVDPHHKPELLVAVEEFEALCGFRHPADSAALLATFEVPRLARVIDVLRHGSITDRLSGAVALLLGWPVEDRADLVAAVAAAGRSRAGGCPAVGAYALAAALGERHPADVGVVVALLLNHVRLAPDEAIFLPAGNLHTYLRGTGVEVMAASDNVLRGGLTSKRVDPDELVRVLRYDVLVNPVIRPVTVCDGVLTWQAPVAEFALVKAVGGAEPVSMAGLGPRIVICLRGEAVLGAGAEGRKLCAGEAVFVSAAEPTVTLMGEGAVVFQASPGLF